MINVKIKAGLLASFLYMVLINNPLFAQVFKVGAVEMPPYQMMKNGELRGSVIDLIDCALNLSYIQYEVDINSRKRNIQLLEKGELDLIFGLEHDLDLNAFSTHTMPIVLEKWIWLANQAVDVTDYKTLITVVSGSNQARWLKQQGYTNVQEVNSLQDALNRFQEGGEETLLVDETRVTQLAQIMQLDLTGSHRTFNRFTTLFAYVSNQYLSNNRDFIAELNENILECHPIGVVLDKHSHFVLLELSKQLLLLTQNADVISRLRRQNKFPLKMDAILYQDREWRAQRKRQMYPMISRLIKNDLSKMLREFTQQNQGIFNEVFVVDQSGLIVALSHISSDLWQGDEMKFSKVFNQEKRIFICNIRFDESSGAFVSHISIAIKDLISGEDIGVFIFGVDVEAVLKADKIDLKIW